MASLFLGFTAAMLTSLSTADVIVTKPKFENFRVAPVYHEVAVPPQFLSGDLDSLPLPESDPKCINPYLPNEYSNKRANFAGHFVLAQCSCGSGCGYMFVWDAKNGKVYHTMPYGALEIGPYVYDGHSIVFKGLIFRVDSNLLIAEGCFDQDAHPTVRDCARRYFTWNGARFTRIYSERILTPSPVTK